MFNCNKCGQSVKDENGVMISGKWYGRDCAATMMGLNQFPTWFKGGDYDKAKADYEANQIKLANQLNDDLVITEAYYSEWYELSIAYKNARRANEWSEKFINSLSKQLGYNELLSGAPSSDFNESKKYLIQYDLLLRREPRRISTLSAKQLNILKQYL